MKEQEMITIAEASKRTGIPRRTIRSAVQQKRIYAESVQTPRGPVWLIPVTEIDRFQVFYTPKNRKIKKS